MSSAFPPPVGRPVVPGTAPAGAAASAPVAFLAPGTLSRQLVLRVTALVALVAVALSGVTLFAVRQVFEGNLDRQLLEMAGRDGDHDAGSGMGGGGGGLLFRQDGLLFYGTVYQQGSRLGSTFAFVQAGGRAVPLSGTAQQQLDGLPDGGRGVPVTMNVDGAGPYRLLVFAASGNRNVVGLPMALVNRPLFDLLPVAAVLTLGAIALALFAAGAVVRRSLAPLQRLASTAHQVSTLELTSGEVDLPVRAPDTDPRSEVGRVGQAFNLMLDNVEGALSARQASEMKVRQFVADASHELRNPLASIRGYAELTRRERADTPETTAHALARIESESARMSALVEDLLLLARLDSGPSLVLRPTPLNELVANAVSDAQAAGPEHAWELELPPAEVVAHGDAARLHQVLANLLANARTHTPAGTSVRTSLGTEGGYAVVRVADSGPGIPDSIRGKVFERFTRADAARARSGGGQSTGLGLAIVAAVLQAHRGTASVETSPAGTTFTLRIPLAHPAG